MEDFSVIKLRYRILPGDELSPVKFRYRILPGDELSPSVKFKYWISEDYLRVTADFNAIKFRYRIQPIIKTTSIANDGGTLEAISAYFQSFVCSTIEGTRSVLSPLSPEYYARYLVNASVNGIAIPQEYVIKARVEWDFNTPIKWSLSLANYDREWTYSESSYYGYIGKGIYSHVNYCQKFFKLQFTSVYNEAITNQKYIFDELVITNNPGAKIIELSGVDKISNVLFSKTDLDVICLREIGVPVADSPAVKLTTSNGTVYYWKNYESQVEDEYITISGNSITVNQGFLAGQKLTGIVEYFNTQFEFPSLTNLTAVITKLCINGVVMRYDGVLSSGSVISYEDYPDDWLYNEIQVIAIKSVKLSTVVKALIENAIDDLPTNAKVDFQVRISSDIDYIIDHDVTVQNAAPIKIIEELIRPVNGEWIILPDSSGKLSLVIQRRPVDRLYPTNGQYILQNSALRGDLSMNNSNVELFTKVNAIKPAWIVPVYEEEE